MKRTIISSLLLLVFCVTTSFAADPVSALKNVDKADDFRESINIFCEELIPNEKGKVPTLDEYYAAANGNLYNFCKRTSIKPGEVTFTVETITMPGAVRAPAKQIKGKKLSYKTKFGDLRVDCTHYFFIFDNYAFVITGLSKAVPVTAAKAAEKAKAKAAPKAEEGAEGEEGPKDYAAIFEKAATSVMLQIKKE